MIEEIDTEAETGLEVAVIGMAGRFPGADSIAEFQDNLENGVESVTFFSGEELEKAGVESRLLENPGYVKVGSILEGVEYFDALFFGYTPREAEVLDPQVRMFHECAWQALEDAACDPDSYEGFIGVYAGASSNFAWQALTLLKGPGSAIDPFTTFQLKEKDFLCLHISYRLNLKGPSVFVSSACSTSLAAVVLASQGLLSGECDMALAGGTAVHNPRQKGYLYEEGKIPSPDGHCRAFDAGAAGTVPGSGLGVVVLKLLEKAREDGDHIYAVIKGSGMNNDGERKVGFTAPSVDGQAEVIRAALRMADAPAESITYLEGHGTGTTLGDPVEIEALKLAFDTHKKGFCAIGSVKTNFGHLDSAAGISGFIKTVLALKHKRIPPSLHFQTPNPRIDFENSPFYVNTRLREWHNEQYPLRAGVSSFGIGGNNVHVVLEQAPVIGHSSLVIGEKRNEKKYQLMVLSAKSESALGKMTENLAGHLKENSGINLADAAYTLQVGRKRFPHRRTAVCSTAAEAAEILSAPGSPKRHTFYSPADKDKPPLIFMFPGQGSQYVNMGRELYEKEPVFREEINRCMEILKPLTNYDIKEILYPSLSVSSVSSVAKKIDQTEVAQPLLFTVEYALAKLLTAWGIAPYAMMGHSIGEYTAAHLSGVFSLEDALQLVVLRGKLMQRMPAGAMLSVPLPENELIPLLGQGISLAAVNSPASCTVSGPTDSVSAFEKQMKELGHECRVLHTSHAFHSSMMAPIIEEFETAVGKVSLQQPQIPYISNLTGDWITGDEAADPAYWSRHLRQTVRFADGVTRLLEEENALFIEAGPGMVLSTLAGKHPGKKPGQKTVNLLRHPGENVPDDEFLLGKIGQLWLYGAAVDWKGFHAGEKRKRLSLPTYPFEKQRFPAEEPASLMQLHPGFQLPLAKRADVGEWFYQPSWKRVHLPPPDEESAQPPSRWCLVFNNPEGPVPQWGKLLEEEGLEIIEVKEGKEFSRESNRCFTLAPAEPGHYVRLFRHLHEEEIVPHRILHSWNLGDMTNREDTIADTLDRAYYSLLYLAQAVGKYNPEDTVQMVVLSDHMQDVTGEPVQCPGKAALLGPVQTIPREYPHLHCRSIDITVPSPGSKEEGVLIRQLVREMATGCLDNAAAYRNYNGYWTRWVRHVEPAVSVKPADLTRRLREGGVYLITGGLGGIGLSLAGYLAGQAKIKLVLVGRSPQKPLTGEDFPALKELEARGAEAVYRQADAADLQQLEAVVRQAEERFGSINGVIHCAGEADAGMIQHRTRDMSETVFAAKIKGTLNLDTIFRNRDLDFLVLCSSMASLWAPFGQVAYTAANCFMDAYAHSKGRENKPFIVSINWDTWQQVGMAEKAIKRLAEAGNVRVELDISAGILPAEGQEVFGRILAGPLLPQVLVSTRDLPLLVQQSREDFTDFSEDLMEMAAPKTVYQRPEMSTEYLAPGTENEKMLSDLLRNLLGIDRVGIFDNFFELGVSSLDVININNRLKKIPGMEISTVIIFENPTVQSLAGYLDMKMSKDMEGPLKERKDRSEEIDTGKNRLQRMLKKTKEA